MGLKFCRSILCANVLALLMSQTSCTIENELGLVAGGFLLMNGGVWYRTYQNPAPETILVSLGASIISLGTSLLTKRGSEAVKDEKLLNARYKRFLDMVEQEYALSKQK